MERKHVSAFDIYRSSIPSSESVKEVLPKKKKKRKLQNGGPIVQSKNKKKVARDVLQSNKSTKQERPLDDAHLLSKVMSEESTPLHCLLDSLTKISNSKDRASALFQWLIHPVPSKDFFRDTWEKKPLLVRRKKQDYYKGLFSTAEFDRILRDEDVQFGVNLDVTSYINGKRETHNPPGRALPYTVWDFYESGCSLRMLNPQAFSSTVWNILSILQELFGSMAGANVYLTPAGTQGFAPHYDDIEAFVVQLEGKKHWRVYNPSGFQRENADDISRLVIGLKICCVKANIRMIGPGSEDRSEDEVLPVLSSPNFNQAAIGKPILDVVLEAGDLLYFPRGFIHQGNCLPDSHSLHITISSYQKNSWGDLLIKLVPAAVELAMDEDVEFRKGLPLDYLSYMGVQNSDKEDPRREDFLNHISSLMKKLVAYAPVDAAVDQKARDFLHDCLPPVLTAAEKNSSIYGAPARWENGGTSGLASHMKPQTRIRLIRAGVARLCSDGEEVSLYYTVENSRVYHKEETKSFEVKPEFTDSIEFLLHSYPKFVTVSSLPCQTAEEKISLADLLFEKGLIHASEPLTAE